MARNLPKAFFWPLSFVCLQLHPALGKNDQTTYVRRSWTGGRVVEGARLESVYTVTPYRGFESLPVRH